MKNDYATNPKTNPTVEFAPIADSTRHTAIHSDLIWWEAEHADGFVLTNRNGGLYRHIDRTTLKHFRIVTAGEILAQITVDAGHPGKSLVYRKRTSMSDSNNRDVVYLFGWQPQGPIFLLDPKETQLYVRPDFEGDGIFERPIPHPDEGEQWTHDHRSDVMVATEKIVLPSGYEMPNPAIVRPNSQ